MFGLLKYFITFVLSFMIFSFPIQKRPLFYHLHENISPVSDSIFEKTKDMFRSTKEFSKKLFTNSVPVIDSKLQKGQDQVKIISSALEKQFSEINSSVPPKKTINKIKKKMKNSPVVQKNEHSEEFSSSDIKKLNDLIKSNQ